MGYFCPEKQQCHPAVPLSQTMTHGHAPTPQNILSSTCFFYIFVFYFISYLLQTVTHDQSSKPHNILSCTRPFFRFSCFVYYPIHYIQTGTHDQAPTAQNSFSSFGLLCFITFSADIEVHASRLHNILSKKELCYICINIL